MQHCYGAAGDRGGTAQAGEEHACLHCPRCPRQASSGRPAGGRAAQQLMPATSQQWRLPHPSSMLDAVTAAAWLSRLTGPQPTRTAAAPIVPGGAPPLASRRSCRLHAAVHPCWLTMPPLPLPLLCPQALVDFPGQTRRVISFKRLAITDYTVDIPRLAKKAVLKKALEEAGAWLSGVFWLGAARCCACAAVGHRGCGCIVADALRSNAAARLVRYLPCCCGGQPGRSNLELGSSEQHSRMRQAALHRAGECQAAVEAGTSMRQPCSWGMDWMQRPGWRSAAGTASPLARVLRQGSTFCSTPPARRMLLDSLEPWCSCDCRLRLLGRQWLRTCASSSGGGGSCSCSQHCSPRRRLC